MMKGRFRWIALFGIICLLMGADRATDRPADRLAFHSGNGYRVGYPAGWQIDDSPALPSPLVMEAEPTVATWWQWLPGWWTQYEVSLHPQDISLEEAVAERLRHLRGYPEFVLGQHSQFVRNGRVSGHLLRASYDMTSPDMESFPTGDTTLFTTTGTGQVLEVRHLCARQACRIQEPTIHAVMNSVVLT